MDHYDLLPVEDTEKFMGAMLEMPKSGLKKNVWGGLFACVRPSTHYSQSRRFDYRVLSLPVCQAVFLSGHDFTLYSPKTFQKLVDSMTPQIPHHRQTDAPGHHHLYRELQECIIQFIRNYGSNIWLSSTSSSSRPARTPTNIPCC